MQFAQDNQGNLVITIPVNTKGFPSKSGKSMVLDSTHGFTSFAHDLGQVKISVNVTTNDESWKGGMKPAAAPPTLVKRA